MANAKKPWEEHFYIDFIMYQIDWGNHPRTGDWKNSYTVFSIETKEPVTERKYGLRKDAERSAAQIYNNINKLLLT